MVTAIWDCVIQRPVIDWVLVERGLTGTDSLVIIILGHSRGGPLSVWEVRREGQLWCRQRYRRLYRAFMNIILSVCWYLKWVFYTCILKTSLCLDYQPSSIHKNIILHPIFDHEMFKLHGNGPKSVFLITCFWISVIRVWFSYTSDIHHQNSMETASPQATTWFFISSSSLAVRIMSEWQNWQIYYNFIIAFRPLPQKRNNIQLLSWCNTRYITPHSRMGYVATAF